MFAVPDWFDIRPSIIPLYAVLVVYIVPGDGVESVFGDRKKSV
jgi:hypothetical protein